MHRWDLNRYNDPGLDWSWDESGESIILTALKVYPHHLMQFSEKPKTPIFFFLVGEILHLYRGYNRNILSPQDNLSLDVV